MTRALCIPAGHLQRFADASGDRNPLHTDATFARATPYGRRIAQGALVTIGALAVVDADTLERVDTLHVRFKQAVFPDEDYTTSLLDSESDKVRIEVAHEGQIAVTISCTVEREAPLPRVVGQPRCSS